MPRTTLRLAVALLTCTLGLTSVWLTNLGSRFTDAVFDRLMPTPALDFPSDPGAQLDPFADTYAVYSKILGTFLSEDVRLVVIERQAGGLGPWADDPTERSIETFAPPLQNSMPTVQHETLADYLAQNRAQRQLSELFQLNVRYVLVEKSNLAKLAKPASPFGFWDRFYAKYPDSPGIVGFSNVGFNLVHTQSFVYMARSCGGLCGEGTYILLERRAGNWEIVAQQIVWVS